jgi:hypothetical protein
MIILGFVAALGRVGKIKAYIIPPLLYILFIQIQYPLGVPRFPQTPPEIIGNVLQGRLAELYFSLILGSSASLVLVSIGIVSGTILRVATTKLSHPFVYLHE